MAAKPALEPHRPVWVGFYHHDNHAADVNSEPKIQFLVSSNTAHLPEHDSFYGKRVSLRRIPAPFLPEFNKLSSTHFELDFSKTRESLGFINYSRNGRNLISIMYYPKIGLFGDRQIIGLPNWLEAQVVRHYIKEGKMESYRTSRLPLQTRIRQWARSGLKYGEEYPLPVVLRGLLKGYRDSLRWRLSKNGKTT